LFVFSFSAAKVLILSDCCAVFLRNVGDGAAVEGFWRQWLWGVFFGDFRAHLQNRVCAMYILFASSFVVTLHRWSIQIDPVTQDDTRFYGTLARATS
jgi:hypothetical protein